MAMIRGLAFVPATNPGSPGSGGPGGRGDALGDDSPEAEGLDASLGPGDDPADGASDPGVSEGAADPGVVGATAAKDEAGAGVGAGP